MFTVAQALDHLERLLPSRLAADWDNVGLLLGDRAAPVSRVMTCLTVTPSTAAEAITHQAQLIVSHHPILFRGVKRLTTDNTEGRMLLDLARAGVAVYSPHTAFDNARDGINEFIASHLDLTDLVPLRRAALTSRQVKLVVFVPDSDLARVSDALFAAGGGIIGEYRDCSFRLAGTGTFHGSDAANPTIGQKGRREEVSEWRLEVVCPERQVPQIVAAMRRAHSYEEPAFDLYPLQPIPDTLGDGRIGLLPKAIPVHELAHRLRQALHCGPIQLVGTANRAVQRVAIVCGAGGEMLPDVLRARADVFITGELRYHDYLAADAAGLTLLLPGHHATERPGVEELARRLARDWPAVHVWASESERDPVTWL